MVQQILAAAQSNNYVTQAQEGILQNKKAARNRTA
jgi:hypothetical protein